MQEAPKKLLELQLFPLNATNWNMLHLIDPLTGPQEVRMERWGPWVPIMALSEPIGIGPLTPALWVGLRNEAFAWSSLNSRTGPELDRPKITLMGPQSLYYTGPFKKG